MLSHFISHYWLGVILKSFRFRLSHLTQYLSPIRYRKLGMTSWTLVAIWSKSYDQKLVWLLMQSWLYAYHEYFIDRRRHTQIASFHFESLQRTGLTICFTGKVRLCKVEAEIGILIYLRSQQQNQNPAFSSLTQNTDTYYASSLWSNSYIRYAKDRSQYMQQLRVYGRLKKKLRGQC